MTLATRLRHAAREPLLHFLVLGAALFGIDHVLNGRGDDPRTITVSRAVDQEAKDIFQAGMNRAPSAGDMKILRDRWVDNEVLYREGLALGLDRGDAAIRERVIFKSLSVAQAGLTLPKIDEAGVRAWFETRRAKYDAPTRYDFLEAVTVGDNTPEALRAFVQALNGQGRSSAQSDLRVFKDRPRGNLDESYGADFAPALEKLAPGQWALLPSAQGVRVVNLQVVKPGSPARFDDMKDIAYRDWKDETMAQLSTRAVRELGSKYAVRIEAEAP